MKILFAVPWLTKADGGIYHYSLNVLREVVELDHDFYVACKNPPEELFRLEESNSNLHLINSKEVKRSLPGSIRYYFNEIRNQISSIREGSIKYTKNDQLFDRAIKKYGIHLIHSPTQQFFGTSGVPSIVTIHDVQELHFPEFFNSSERVKRAISYKRAIDLSDAVIVSYNHIKADIVKYFEKPENEVFVCPISLRNIWINNFQLGENNNGEEKFILYPASTWPHKNHIRLLEAMAILKQKGELNVNLICTGYKTGNMEDILTVREKLGLEKEVTFRGIVSDEELLKLYRSAHAVVIPTLYEAGSYPLMESILLETPVISSNVTSLPETMGNPEFIFDPYDIDDISRKLRSVTIDLEFRKRNKDHIKKQKEKLKEISVAESFEKVYSTIHN